MSTSPWSAYGRMPPKPAKKTRADESDPALRILHDAIRGREQVQKYLHNIVQEYNEIHSGRTGYRNIIADALKPPPGPETVEEHLHRLAREAMARRNDRTPRA